MPSGAVLHYERSMRKPVKILLGILAAILVADVLVQVAVPVRLQGFFTNDDGNLFPAETIQRAYGKAIGGRVAFEDDIYVILEGKGRGDPLVTASTSKIMAYIAAKELDFIVTTREVYEHYAPALRMADLHELLPEFPSGWFLYKTDPQTGKETAVALDMAHSRFVEGHPYPVPYYLFIPANSIRQEAAAAFIRWAFQESSVPISPRS